MKNKMKNLFVLPLLVIPVSITSCSWFNFDIDGSYTSNITRTYQNNINYIAQRSFSLRFVGSADNSAVYGTGWIFAKDNDDKNTPTNYYDDTYYIATNLHVAAAIQNRGKYLYQLEGKKYVRNYQQYFTYMQLGQVVTNNNLGTNYTTENITNTIYTGQVPLSSVSIAYTSFDLFRNMNISNPYKVYNESVINNGTMDLAILKVDFKNMQYYSGYSNSANLIHKELDVYNNSPTKFAIYSSGENITIGGFPFKENTQVGNGAWNVEYHPKPHNSFNTNIIKSGNIAPGYVWANQTYKEWNQYYINSGAYSVSDFKSNYVFPNNIDFKYDGYASYTNIALQAYFKNIRLTGGSSGSLALNDDNEVVGIYWGGYESSTFGPIGAIDLFINKNTYTANNQVVLKPYDIIQDFIDKNNNTNLNEIYNL